MMTSTEVEVSRWYGRPIRELTREELLDVIAYLSNQLDDTRKTFESVEEIHRLAREARTVVRALDDDTIRRSCSR
jgi:hypothetical protein